MNHSRWCKVLTWCKAIVAGVFIFNCHCFFKNEKIFTVVHLKYHNQCRYVRWHWKWRLVMPPKLNYVKSVIESIREAPDSQKISTTVLLSHLYFCELRRILLITKLYGRACILTATFNVSPIICQIIMWWKSELN